MTTERTTDHAAMELDLADRKPFLAAISIAIALHVGLLAARLPEGPARIETPVEELEMTVQFLEPSPPPPEAPPPELLRREPRRVPRPDPTPEEPEPVVVPPPPAPRPPSALSPLPAPLAAPAPASLPVPAPPEPASPEPGPIRVSLGQGPGIVKKVEPLYPPAARAARQEGTVVLDVLISRAGTVTGVTLVRSARPMLDKAAMEALGQWRFSPGERDVIMTLTVHFRLD